MELEIGNGTAQFMVDTGASFELEISERLQRELGLSLDSGEVVEGRNWMGSDRKHRQQLPSVRVGDAEVGPCELLVTLREGSQWRHTNQAGADEAVLGSRFLRRFRVRIDYKHRRMSLVPAAAMEPGAAKEPRPVESLEPMPVPSDPS